MNQKLEKYIGIVEFLGKTFGEDTEVALHDVSDLEASVVAIANGHLSNRQVGAPATNLALKIMQSKKYDQDSIINYKSVSEKGHEMCSSTYFIKDNEEIIGMLCINRDISKILEVKSLIDEIFNTQNIAAEEQMITEKFAQSSEQLKSGSIDDIVKSYNIPPQRMSSEEKINVVKKLDEAGIFLIKGAVSDVAKILYVSEPTIYRYLKMIKNSL